MDFNIDFHNNPAKLAGKLNEKAPMFDPNAIPNIPDLMIDGLFVNFIKTCDIITVAPIFVPQAYIITNHQFYSYTKNLKY